ncbi:hypothetical protein HK405_009975 [Cladochytrium tenue]|nr:hypothetical protein HK405_009975 [Cladochytrium tenue]
MSPDHTAEATGTSGTQLSWRYMSAAVPVAGFGVMFINGLSNTDYATYSPTFSNLAGDSQNSWLLTTSMDVQQLELSGDFKGLQFGHSCVSANSTVYCTGMSEKVVRQAAHVVYAGGFSESTTSPENRLYTIRIEANASATVSLSTSTDAPSGKQFAGRGLHASALLNNTIYLLGGQGCQFCGEMWLASETVAIDLSTGAFETVNVSSSRVGRFSGSCAVSLPSGRALLFGGSDEHGRALEDFVWTFEPNRLLLESTNTSGHGPDPRWGVSCGLSADGKTAFVHGGCDPSGLEPDDDALYTLDIETMSWTNITGAIEDQDLVVSAQGSDLTSGTGYYTYSSSSGGWVSGSGVNLDEPLATLETSSTSAAASATATTTSSDAPNSSRVSRLSLIAIIGIVIGGITFILVMIVVITIIVHGRRLRAKRVAFSTASEPYRPFGFGGQNAGYKPINSPQSSMSFDRTTEIPTFRAIAASTPTSTATVTKSEPSETLHLFAEAYPLTIKSSAAVATNVAAVGGRDPGVSVFAQFFRLPPNGSGPGFEVSSSAVVEAATASLKRQAQQSFSRSRASWTRRVSGIRLFDPTRDKIAPVLAPVEEAVEDADGRVLIRSTAVQLVPRIERLIATELGDLTGLPLDVSASAWLAVSPPLRMASVSAENESGAVRIPEDETACVQFVCMRPHAPRAGDELQLEFGDVVVVR